MKKNKTAAEYVKYLADNHIKITLPEDNRKYYGQQCQEDSLNIDFREFHKHLVNEVIDFCKSHGITIDEFHLNADCLEDSIKAGSWQACTDSCFQFDKFSEEYKDVVSMRKVVSEQEFRKITEIDNEPFMVSM